VVAAHGIEAVIGSLDGAAVLQPKVTGGDHDPPHPFMVVRGHGFLIDLSRISGELWDQNLWAN
jgi:hypothetical protein